LATGEDQAFVTRIAGAGMGEIELGQLAQEKASDASVKAFGKRMVEEHSKAGDALKVIADRKGLSWPTTPPPAAAALKDRLSKLNGSAFDRAYTDAMVAGHREAVAAVRTESQTGADPDVKAWAVQTLPTIEAHLTHAQNVQRDVNKTATH
jgi:putative membrane protein